MKKEFIMPLSGISASSCLTEGKTEYSSSDLTDKIGKPWVEGKWVIIKSCGLPKKAYK